MIRSRVDVKQGWYNARMMVQNKNGAKQECCKAIKVQIKDGAKRRMVQSEDGARQRWYNARMAQSKDGAKQGCYKAWLV